ncbi:MAG TPA: TolC family protein [Terriglobales bacterium]|nr:TolC family protein [Terriglobales bacterium]
MQPSRSIQRSGASTASVALLLLVIIAAPARFAVAQAPLTLAQAVSMALDRNPLHKAALAETRIGAAAVRQAQSPLMPKITFSESALRGNDPVFVFGSRLRQQNFTAADFALNQLNTPTPISNFSSRFSGQWNLFDGLQSWYGVTRAKYMKQAAEQQLDRADQELVYQAVQAYYGTLLAQRQVQVAEAGVETAQAIEASSRVRVESGMVVESDLLSAQVATASRKQELIAAQNALSLARTQLALAVGASSDALFEPQEVLTDRAFSPLPVAELEQLAIEKRPDLKRMESEHRAQDKNISAAKGAFAPRLNVFGSWETDSPSPGWNGGNNWIAGAELQFDLFDGDSKRSNLAMQKAVQEKGTAMRDAFRDQIRLQVRKAYYDFDTAQQQVRVARSAIAQADESLRINQNRYDGGLTTISDLLRVQEAAQRAKNDYWQAVYRVQTSYAGVELAAGTLNASSPVVTQ